MESGSMDDATPSAGAATTLSMQTPPSSRPSPLLPDPGSEMAAVGYAGIPPCVPQGLDAASYVAGERAAYARAFASALPSQQAMGQLFHAVDTLHARLEADAAAVRALQISAGAARATLDSAVQRLQHAEQCTLPELQRKFEEVATRPALSPEVAAALANLRDVLDNLSTAQRQYLEAAAAYIGPGGFLVHQLQWLVGTAAGYSAALLSRADVAAVLLSRKVLVGDLGGWRAPSQRSQTQAVTSAALFVGAVEVAWQVHSRVTQRLPTTVQGAMRPAHAGLRVARVAVWSAAFVLAAAEVRRGCSTVARRLTRGPPPQPPSSPPPPSDLMHDNTLYDPHANAPPSP